MSDPAALQTELVEDISSFQDDPLGYVMYAFPWGEPGGPLAVHTLRGWQRDVLDGIGQRLRAGAVDAGEVIREAVASGHGIGKSALVAMIVMWAMDTREDTRGVVTANTDTQLRTKTWPELVKWHRMSITSHWSTVTATAIISNSDDHSRTWRIDAVPWSETNLEAFAGLHNEGKRLLLVFDEAAGIASKVWEVAGGALTDKDTEIIWTAFGNPTRPSGGFRDCFDSPNWNCRHIDSRTVEGINLVELEKVVAEYGEDSDVVKVRIRGQFPSVGSEQFIGQGDIDAALQRDAHPDSYKHAARVIGVDVARHGDDRSSIIRRQGRVANKPKTLRITDLMALAAEVAHHIDSWKPDAVFIDATGIGWGVVDRLRQMGYGKIIYAVQTGEKAQSPYEYHDHRAELWGRMRQWLTTDGAIEAHDELMSELVTPEYDYDNSNRLRIESKKRIKARGEPSPDSADALALTFHIPIKGKQHDGIPDWKRKLLGRSTKRLNPMTA